MRDYVLGQPAAGEFLDRLEALLETIYVGFLAERKHYLNLAVGCTGGKHRSVAMAEAVGRAHRNIQIVLPFSEKPGINGLQQGLQPGEELGCRRLAEDVVAHLGVQTAERLELGLPVGVGQEAHVQHHVGVDRDAVLEAEGDDGRAQPASWPSPNTVRIFAASWWTFRLEVSMSTSALPRRSPISSRSRRIPSSSRPRPAAGAAAGRLLPATSTSLEPPGTASPGGTPFSRRSWMAEPSSSKNMPVRTSTTTASRGARAVAETADDRGEEHRRQVVHYEPAEVLQHVGDGAPSRAGHARDDDEVAARLVHRLVLPAVGVGQIPPSPVSAGIVARTYRSQYLASWP